MKVPSIFRSTDWWDYKIVPLLTIGYLTIMLNSFNLVQHIAWLLFLILAIAVGAIYVSIINDYTDVKFDLDSGKSNRLAKFTPFKRALILALSILISLCFCIYFSSNLLSFTFYFSAYIMFSLYSTPPFRFKNRGILGVIADASGAHLFPSLFVYAAMVYKLEIEVNYYLLILITIWSLACGLRGNMWHQFWDRENDLSINHNTFATSISNINAIKPFEIIISIIEVISLFLILVKLGFILPIIGLFFYSILLLGYKKIKYKIIVILSENPPWHIFMSDFYEVILPFTLIFTCTFYYPWSATLLLVHFILFPKKPVMLLKNIKMMLKSLLKK